MKLPTLARKNVRQSKSIIFMIALASMLICSVINLGFSARQSLKADPQDPSATAFTAVILLILCAAGALAVYNAYNLSVVKRIHQYGLMTVIGASQKQIRRCVYIEALYCSLLGLPAGLFAGTLAGVLGMSALNMAMNIPMNYAVTPAAYLLSCAVTLATVYIGVRRPVRTASQIAPVEAVRFSDAAENVTGRETVENVTLNALVKINMARSRRRLIGTVASLSLSGILFLGFSTVAFSIHGSVDELAGQMTAGDIQVTAGRFGVTQNPDPITRELAEAIRGIDGVTGLVSVMAVRLGKINYATYGHIVGVEPDVMQKIIGRVYDGAPGLPDFSEPGNVIAVMPSQERMESYIREGFKYHEMTADYKLGNTLTFNPSDHMVRSIDEIVSLNIIGIVCEDDIPQYKPRAYIYPDLYTLQDNFTALGLNEAYSRLVLEIDGAKHDGIYRAVEQLCAHDPELTAQSHKRVRDELSRMASGIIAVVLLMLGVIALNGVMNLIGATVIGVEQRKRELGVLMAVGLSRKAVGKLLTREGFWVSLLSSALSVVFGLAAGLGLYQLVVYAGADYMHFVFPLWPLVSLCAALGLVPYAVTLLAARRLRRFTLVELLGRQT